MIFVNDIRRAINVSDDCKVAIRLLKFHSHQLTEKNPREFVLDLNEDKH